MVKLLSLNKNSMKKTFIEWYLQDHEKCSDYESEAWCRAHIHFYINALTTFQYGIHTCTQGAQYCAPCYIENILSLYNKYCEIGVGEVETKF